ncbi:MAG: hypothetical protein GY757_26250, partial [bacterium]|nr:hypothetical protein [bacterium]
MRIRFSILIASFFFSILLYPAKENLKFEYITDEQGLSNSIIKCITQDKRGFMWFGTENGLNMYDGYRITSYKNIPGNPNSLSFNFVWAICGDRTGNIWIGTDHGLDKFDPVSESFTHYHLNHSRSDRGKVGNRDSQELITAIKED